jgi:lysophospholipase L1-like esterase
VPSLRRQSPALACAVVLILFSSTRAETPAEVNFHLRGTLTNSCVKFEKEKTGHIAFLGGSITEMEGFRPLVCALLKRRFPDTKFTFTNAGVASTCSTTGAMRLQSDVLSRGSVDLFFVEFAVNDDQDAHHTRAECIRGMEGIVRHVRAHNPNADIVLIHFVNEDLLKSEMDGKPALPIEAHEAVARHYDVSSINVAAELANRIAAGTLTWKEYGGVHPARPGHELCLGLIERLFDAAWKEKPAKVEPHSLPKEPLDSHHYGNGRFIDPASAMLEKGWKIEVPEWKNLKGNCRSRFSKLPLLCATQPGSTLTLKFTGTAVGAYILAGPDAGVVEASIDDGPFAPTQLRHPFSTGLHYPRTLMFATELKPGPHALRLRTTGDRDTAARIVQFVAN